MSILEKWMNYQSAGTIGMQDIELIDISYSVLSFNPKKMKPFQDSSRNSHEYRSPSCSLKNWFMCRVIQFFYPMAIVTREEVL